MVGSARFKRPVKSIKPGVLSENREIRTSHPKNQRSVFKFKALTHQNKSKNTLFKR